MTQSKNYGLSETERDYLRTGQTGSYSEANLQDRIQKKQDNIGFRINAIIRDISLMYRSKVYEFETSKNDFMNDLNLKEIYLSLDARLSREDLTKDVTSLDRSEIIETPERGEEFGFLLGGFLHILLSMTQIDKPWKSTLRGLCYFFLTGTGNKPINRLNDLEEISNFEYIGQYPVSDYEAKAIISRYTYTTYIAGRPAWIDDFQKMLDKNNIPSTDSLLYYLEDWYFNKELESNSDELIGKFSDIDDKFGSVIKLYKEIHSDKKYLENIWRGPNRLDIIQQMCCDRSKIRPSTIASNLGESPSTHLVTNGLKRMSAETDETQRWTSHSVTEEFSDGWKLTPYGRLLAMYSSGELTAFEIEHYAVPETERYYLPNQECLSEENKNIISEALNQFSKN